MLSSGDCFVLFGIVLRAWEIQGGILYRVVVAQLAQHVLIQERYPTLFLFNYKVSEACRLAKKPLYSGIQLAVIGSKYEA